MPYIRQEDRDKLDRIVESICVASCELHHLPGVINYILFAYCKRYIKESYKDLSAFVGELESCKLEIYRTIIGPHEDKKKEENGDV